MVKDASGNLERFYREYVAHCNVHDFDALGDYVAEDVVVNGEVQGLQAYVAGLEGVIRAFPDYHWDLRHLFVREPWIYAHFIDTGTHSDTFLDTAATGRRVQLQEFAVYRHEAGRLAEVWVAADNMRLLQQIRD